MISSSQYSSPFPSCLSKPVFGFFHRCHTTSILLCRNSMLISDKHCETRTRVGSSLSVLEVRSDVCVPNTQFLSTHQQCRSQMAPMQEAQRRRPSFCLKGSSLHHQPADTSDIDTSSYPPTVEWPWITKEELERAIKCPGQDKAPGPCKTPNRALREGITVLLPHLERLFNASVYFPTRLGSTPIRRE